jgi:RNA polymerase sigma factor (sigma-70 family)
MALDRKEFSELLARAKSGDRDAQKKLFSLLGNEECEPGAAVLIMARTLLKNNWVRSLLESKDIVQSALREGWLNVCRFRGSTEVEFYAWLRAILRSKVTHAVRMKLPLPQDLRPEGEENRDVAANEESALAAMIEDEMRQRVRSALDGLPEDQRLILELRIQGKSAPEIADALGLNPAAVRKRESRIIERLRQLLE